MISKKAKVKQRADKDGLDRSYSADNDLSIIDNTIYIAGTQMNRPSDWRDYFVKVPTLWKTVPITNQYKKCLK